MRKKLGLYIHIPFCEKKCKYCDFLSFPSEKSTYKEYTLQLVNEIRARSPYYKDYQIDTIFIGGGTPSILDGMEILNIMSSVYENFIVEASAEVSIECNPGSLDIDKLAAYKQAGINRISLGLQSTDNKELKLLGRIHTYEDFLDSYEKVRQAGFDNVNIDLMSALPTQTLSSLKSSLKKLVMLKPEHISVYSLKLEENTPFYNYFTTDSGKKYLPSEEVDRAMYDFTNEYLAKNSYNRYEISNYAKKGKECKHNVRYWTGKEFLGIGLGAASISMDRSFHVVRDFNTYMKADFKKDLTFLYEEVEELSQTRKMEDFMIFGLRLTKGIFVGDFFEKFSLNVFDVYGNVIKKHMNDGLLEYKNSYLRLTSRGIDLSNLVLKDFLMD